MASNVYTKNEILQNLASRGYFIDAYTLNTFIAKWNIEAIFEDEQGSEFFDKNALDLVLNNLFKDAGKEKEENKPAEIQPKEETLTIQPKAQQPEPSPIQQPYQQQVQNVQQQSTSNAFIVNDSEAKEVLNSLSLSNGSSLMDNLQNDSSLNLKNIEINLNEAPLNIEKQVAPEKPKRVGILEGAMNSENLEINENMGNSENFVFQGDSPQDTQETIEEIKIDDAPIVPKSTEENTESDFDDMNLISDSLEAQEKFREYLMSEFNKKQSASQQQQQQNNEFKLDISERTINMIARTMAKKIAKHVSSICSADAKSGAELATVKEENKKLEQKAKELEGQNKKLRLLLAESNKNLNSYKPCIFGLYKKVLPGKQ